MAHAARVAAAAAAAAAVDADAAVDAAVDGRTSRPSLEAVLKNLEELVRLKTAGPKRGVLAALVKKAYLELFGYPLDQVFGRFHFRVANMMARLPCVKRTTVLTQPFYSYVQ